MCLPNEKLSYIFDENETNQKRKIKANTSKKNTVEKSAYVQTKHKKKKYAQILFVSLHRQKMYKQSMIFMWLTKKKLCIKKAHK